MSVESGLRKLVTAAMWLIAVSVEAQSIPYPTPLQSLTMQPEAKIVWSREVARIASTEATAIVTAIEVEDSVSGVLSHGILAKLESEEQEDEFLVEQTHFKQFMSELAGMEPSTTKVVPAEPCGAMNSCFSGIARCRPSQHIPQAYCPEIRTYTQGGRSLILRTPQQFFEFPDVLPSVLVTALYLAMEQIKSRRDSGDALAK